MLRLSLLAAAAVLLPEVGGSTVVSDRPATSAAVAAHAFGLPSIRLPKFLRVNRKRGVEQEITEMKTRLRDLVVQQETYYSENGRYGRNVTKVAALARGDSTAKDVQIEILFANSKGWSAIASHPGAPGRSCVAFVGNPESVAIVPRTRMDANVATAEGVPACDGVK